MNEYIEKSETNIDNLHHYFKKSWVAYFKTTSIFIIIFLLSVFFWGKSVLMALLVSTVIILIFIYKILYLKSFKLYTNEEGVWAFSGVLPWQRGVSGVKWRDLDDAVFFQGMISYFCQSYNISIRHRFTKSNEIVLEHIHKGNHAVSIINQLHKDLLNHGLIH